MSWLVVTRYHHNMAVLTPIHALLVKGIVCVCDLGRLYRPKSLKICGTNVYQSNHLIYVVFFATI